MKKFFDTFSILTILFILMLMFLIYNFKKQDLKFEMQSLDVNMNDFKKEWGKPDRISNDSLILFYNCKNYLGDRYVFIFDNNKKLKEKHYDD